MSTQYCTWTKAGRTLDDFKANFKPICIPEQSGGVARFEACRKLFFVPKNPLVCGVITIIYLLPIEMEHPQTQIVNIKHV